MLDLKLNNINNMNDIDERRSLYFLMSTGLFSNNTLKKL